MNPTEAETVRRIFRLYVEEDMGLIPLANLLNAEGVPTLYTGRKMGARKLADQDPQWNPGTLSRILRCTAYVGRFEAGKRAGKEITEIATPPILDQATFDQAQHLLEGV